MSRGAYSIQSFCTLLVTSLGLLVSVHHCAHNDSSLFISGVLAPPLPTNGTCVYTANAEQPRLTSGMLDLAFAQEYKPFILVGNQLSAQSSPSQVRTETARISIQGAEVKVVDSFGQTLSSFTRLSSATIDPSGGTDPKFASFQVMLADSTAINAIANGLTFGQSRRIVARVKVFGRTLGGHDVESNEFQFPIDLCVGCLVTFPPEAGPTCNAGITNASSVVNVCQRGVDQLLDCRLCQGSNACNPTTRLALTYP